ncbi:MAG: CAP domain-containing protein [Planctomycetia bacterium]
MNQLAFFCTLLIVVVLEPSLASAQDAPFVRDVFDRINAQRTQHRLTALAYDKTLEKAAQAHAEWMARNRTMEHLQAPPASFEEHRTCNHHPVNRAINAGYIGWDDVFFVERQQNGAVVHVRPDGNDHVGEIIAAGWGAGHPATQTAQVVDGWMKSPGHRREILTARYREMGIGVACTPDGNDTFWCVLFGRPIK